MRYLFLFLTLLSSGILAAQTKLSPTDFQQRLKKNSKSQLVDVRTPEEYAKGTLEHAKNINWNDKSTFQLQAAKLNKKKPVYVFCFSGGRSTQAAQMLTKEGFTVFELEGGLMKLNSETKASATTAKSNVKDLKGLTLADFQAIQQSHPLVFIDFTAKWCGPCQKIKPYIEKIAADKSYKTKVVYIDADANPDLLKELKISAIPRLQLYKNGKQVWDHTGGLSEAELVQAIKKQL
ncbi:thioredoxin domain-containing protein [Sphingobacterium psychroaquaticum]|uniref:Thioredoxin n=1 Tax=Sphingobacterium psychroaquaticum TaxID=561061 RepID=A0A1X7IP55_9SPHI|nr:thioredoxin domain-containing protein [Sphingobacterium psychroaquaticum]QBQ41317.1 thioredoxin [Sphingobacterium psychroaquaticum]SMG16710.1 thioredoxin [Sphingobacterium psychroaquaticum]